MGLIDRFDNLWTRLGNFWQELPALFVYDPAAPMLFNTQVFLLFFLLFMGGYLFLAGRKPLRVGYVTLFSLFFYYKSSGLFFLLLIASTLIDFFIGRAMGKSEDPKQRRRWLVLSLLANLGILGYFKYTNFLIDTLNLLLHEPLSPANIFLPVGISFFTFQTMSYTIDVYRGKLKPVDNLMDFAFYVTFFPQLVAGPIVRAADFLPQIRQDARVTREDLGLGLLLITTGLFKKAVISDYIAANFVDRVFEAPALYSGFENLMGVYGYALQIYCDFSGYSDMAIGIGLLLGYRLPLNFRSPYQSASIREFWRRWHISLSTWLRDYLYISLGGNRHGRWRTYLHLLVTMLLGGLWHGAAWRFVFWGALHGVALALSRLLADTRADLARRYHAWLDRLDARAIAQAEAGLTQAGPAWVHRLQWLSQGWLSLALSVLLHLGGVIFTFHFVCFCWIFFRAPTYDLAWQMVEQILYQFQGSIAWEVLSGYREVFLLMLLGYVLHFIPEEIDRTVAHRFIQAPVVVKSLTLAFVIWLVIQTRSAEVQPFIYFQF